MNKCVHVSLAELSTTLKTLSKVTSDPISGFKEFYTQTYQQLPISTVVLLRDGGRVKIDKTGFKNKS